jgi:divalent metal cation (Fe/Co/Zn/Cd) transporter
MAAHGSPAVLAIDPSETGVSVVETDECCRDCSPTAQPHDAVWQRATRCVRWLSWASLVWMTAEGVLGLLSGIRDSSISLIGWALGSVVEGLASAIVIWRFSGARTTSAVSERQAQRAVAVSFFLLAPYIFVQALRDLASGLLASPGTLGIVVTATSVVLMPGLWLAKQRLARTLGSGATSGEAVQNLMCAVQGGAVLVGLVATSALGWSWLDPAVALVLAAWAIREGIASLRGADCC